jgi:hypothetical protein
MTDLFSLVRGSDPHTSHQAATAIMPKLSKLQKQVYAFIVARGAVTDADIVKAFPHLAESTARHRRTDLAQKGLVLDSGETRLVNGSERIVWVPAHQNTAETPF